MPAIGIFVHRCGYTAIHIILLILFCTKLTVSQVKVPFTMRYQASIPGNMTLIGNNVLSVTSAGNYNGSSGNHNLITVFVDIDNDTATFNSSNATLGLPSNLTCLEIKKALLYWAAADMEDPGNEPSWLFNRVKFKSPVDTNYQILEADQVIYQGRPEHFYNDPYICVKDITALLPDTADGTYWLANVKARKGTLQSHSGGNTGTSGGWMIVFIYESSDLSPKNIALFDGYVHVAVGMSPNPLPFTFNGFQTVPTGDVNIDFLMGSLEGDWDLTGDYCHIQRVDGTWLSLSTPLRQTNNFFHSIIGLNSSHFVARNPASLNTLGFDADKFPIPNAGNAVIGNNQTSATIRMGTNQEIYGLFLTGLSVDVWNPAILSMFTIPAMPGGSGDTVQAGDTILFEINTRNTGNDDAINVRLSIMIPPGLEFLQAVPPIPDDIVTMFNPVNNELSFLVGDSLVQSGDTSFIIRFRARAITDCILLRDSAVSHPTCHLDVTFRGAVNTIPQTAQGSTAVNKCGRGNELPVKFTIMPPKSLPVARADTAVTQEDIPVGIIILANDDDCDNNIDTSSVTLVSQPWHGVVKILQPGGALMYQPVKNYYGIDSLSYSICDTDNQCDTARVLIRVIPVNDPPVILNEQYHTCQDSLLVGNILMNDADTVENTGLILGIPLIVQPAHGLLLVDPGGNFTYLPNPGFTGCDFAVARVCDTGFPLPPQCDFDTLFLSVDQYVQADAGDDLSLCNTAVTLLTGNDPRPGNGYWTWLEGPDTVQLTSAGPGIAHVEGLVPGTYRFIYIIENRECSSSDTMVLHNHPAPSPAVAGADQVACYHSGDTLALSLHAVNPVSGEGLWSQYSGPSTVLFANPNDPNSLVSGLIPGQYEFVWQTLSAPCPANADTVTVTVNPSVLVHAGPDLRVCNTQPVTLASATASNFTSVEWRTSGSGSFVNPAVINTEYLAMADTSTRDVLLILTAYPLEGCESRHDTLILQVTIPPRVNAGPDAFICTGRNVQLNGTVHGGYTTFKWSHNGKGMLLSENTLNPVYKPGGDEQGTIRFVLSATGAEECLNYTLSDSGIIFVYEAPFVNAGPDTAITTGTVLWLNGVVIGGSGSYSYHWFPETLVDDPFRPDPHTTQFNADTILLLHVYDLVTGCNGTDSLRITLNNNKPNPDEECLMLYNALTPNGDGLNDIWIIDCIENFPVNSLVIVDRWGDPVAEFENYNNHSVVWNGTGRNEKTVPDGTYYYVLTIRDGGRHTGWILVRSGTK